MGLGSGDGILNAPWAKDEIPSELSAETGPYLTLEIGGSCRRSAQFSPERFLDLQAKLDSLLAVAADLGLSIRREALGGEGGGYCLLRGKPVLFIDTLADLELTYDRIVSGMAKLPEIEQRYLPPEVRQDLEAVRR